MLHYLKKFTGNRFYIIYIAFITNIIVSCTAKMTLPEIGWKITFFGVFINLFTSSIIIISLLEERRKNSYFKKFDKIAGDFSYPVYIFHWAGACLAAWLLSMTIFYTSQYRIVFIFSGCLIITLLVSFFVNKIVNDRVEKIRIHVKAPNVCQAATKNI